MHKVSPCIYIIVLGRTDFVHPLFSIISSQSGFIEMDLLQKMFLLVGHEKNVIYSKLVNNPFNIVSDFGNSRIFLICALENLVRYTSISDFIFFLGRNFKSIC